MIFSVPRTGRVFLAHFLAALFLKTLKMMVAVQSYLTQSRRRSAPNTVSNGTNHLLGSSGEQTPHPAPRNNYGTQQMLFADRPVQQCMRYSLPQPGALQMLQDSSSCHTQSAWPAVRDFGNCSPKPLKGTSLGKATWCRSILMLPVGPHPFPQQALHSLQWKSRNKDMFVLADHIHWTALQQHAFPRFQVSLDLTDPFFLQQLLGHANFLHSSMLCLKYSLEGQCVIT